MEKLENASLGYIFCVRGVKPCSHYFVIMNEKLISV